MKDMQTLILILLLLQFLAYNNGDDFFVFDGFSGANLTLTELAEITSTGLVRLTNNTKQAQGHAFFPLPLHLLTNSSFSTAFVFAIVPEYPDVSGHGLALAFSPSKSLLGTMPSQYLGLVNSTGSNPTNRLVAVELDTVQSVDFDDLDDNHVGIDINGLKSKNSSSAAYFDSRSGRWNKLELKSGEPMQVWVEYNGASTQLDVTISPIDVAHKPDRPLVTCNVNLSSIYPDGVYVGFSASTGAATGFHYVMGWSFSLEGEAQPLDISKLPSLPRPSTPRVDRFSSKIMAVALPLAAVIVVLLSVAGGVVALRARKRYSELLEDWEVEYGPQRFHYKDLFIATEGFNGDNLLGAGGFGKVYRGVMPNSGTEVAVKKISHGSRQGMKEFVAEIASMGRLRHRNLVQLLGYCRRDGELILVYDYMPNGSLDRLLFEEGAELSWKQRFGIIKGVASGLLYLHDGWEQVVIHRDIKASNVLLDAELNGKLGDFGLARLYDHGSISQTTHIVGTVGYLAPELSKTGKATTGTDVYAFGAFLLEVACGRRPIEPRSDEPGLVDLVLDCWRRGEIVDAGDKRMVRCDSVVVREMELVLKLGMLCSHTDPMARPSMRQVMQVLEGNAPLPAEMPADEFQQAITDVADSRQFDDFIMSYPSTSATTYVEDSSSNSSKSPVKMM